MELVGAISVCFGVMGCVMAKTVDDDVVVCVLVGLVVQDCTLLQNLKQIRAKILRK